MSLNSTKRIAVITAANLGLHNPGMATVDLAFNSVCRQLSEEHEINWFSLRKPTDKTRYKLIHGTKHPLGLLGADIPFEFQPLIGSLDSIYSHDVIVFWGDFMHSRHYIEQDGVILLQSSGYEYNREIGRKILHRSLLLQDAPDEILDKTILYGGTVLYNTQTDFTDNDYGRAFSRLMTKCRSVWMREPISVANISHVRKDDKVHWGADAALLLDRRDIDRFPKTGWTRSIPNDEVAGVFLGSRTPVPAWLPDVCQKIASRLGLKLQWLPWLYAKPPSEFDVDAPPSQYTLADLMDAISRFKLVITDTYHLSVNAWRCGTPAICIGTPQPSGSPGGFRGVNDLKKQIFYLSYGASDMYLSSIEGATTDREIQLERIFYLIENGDYESIIERIRQHSERSELGLRRAIQPVFQRD